MSDITPLDTAMDDWMRAQVRGPRSARQSFTATGNAATDIRWLRRAAGLIVEPGPDVDGIDRGSAS